MTPDRWREVEEIYHLAMDREPAARSAYVLEACKGDEGLRREVESLLKLNSSPVLVDQPAWQAAGGLLDNDSIVAAGTQLGPYRIEAVLGAGGMGQVYRARDTRLDRLVAIKVSREEFGERFEREARAIAALNLPNVCSAGHELFFSTSDGRIMVAAYNAAGNSFSAGTPHPWMEKSVGLPMSGRTFDVAPDGKHIVAIVGADEANEEASTRQVIFLQNFFDELRRRVPSR